MLKQHSGVSILSCWISSMFNMRSTTCLILVCNTGGSYGARFYLLYFYKQDAPAEQLMLSKSKYHDIILFPPPLPVTSDPTHHR